MLIFRYIPVLRCWSGRSERPTHWPYRYPAQPAPATAHWAAKGSQTAGPESWGTPAGERGGGEEEGKGGAEWVRAWISLSMCSRYKYARAACWLSWCIYIYVYICVCISVSYELLVDASEDGVVEVPGLVQRRLCHTPTTHGQRPK
jgi:hypothetical protein